MDKVHWIEAIVRSLKFDKPSFKYLTNRIQGMLWTEIVKIDSQPTPHTKTEEFKEMY